MAKHPLIEIVPPIGFKFDEPMPFSAQGIINAYESDLPEEKRKKTYGADELNECLLNLLENGYQVVFHEEIAQSKE